MSGWEWGPSGQPDASVVRLRLRPPSSPQAVSWQSAQKTAESHGGQFPSHPGRPGPETSSEGAHSRPNPQEIQAGFCPPPSSNLFVSITPSFPPSRPSSPRRQKSPVNSKHLYEQGPIRGLSFPEPCADEILFFARKNCTEGEGRENRKQSKANTGGGSRSRGDEG